MAEILANKLIGLLVTVGVLAAVYFFAIKPILDTTNDAFEQFGGIDDTVQNVFEEAGIEGSFDDLGSINVPDLQQQIRDAGVSGSEQREANRLLECIQRVQPNTTKMQTCVDRFGS